MPVAALVPHNLPRELTTLVGRTAAAAEVSHLLETVPLVTLVGVGGAGKTRLALRVAHDQARSGGSDVVDGVWLVELAALADPTLVGRALAAVFGVAEQPTRPLEKSTAEGICTRRLLLVLDNCEHLIDAVTWAVPSLRLPASDEPQAVAASEASCSSREQGARVESFI